MTTLQTLLFTPLIAALVVRLLARQPQLMAAAGALTSGVLWLWLRTVSVLETAVVFWGQPMLLTSQNQTLLLLMLAGLFILFGLAIIFPSGDWFVAGGLIGFAFLAASLLAVTFSVAMVLVLLAAGALALTVQSGRAGSVRGSFRYLLAVLLAMPLLLIADWQLTAQPTNWLLPSGELAGLATLLLLAGFPFHVWLQAVANEAEPLPLVLVVGWAPIVPLALLFQQLTIHPNLVDTTFRQLIMLSSGLTLLVAGVLAVTAVHLRRVIGNILLLDMALTILAFLLPEQIGWETAVTLQIGRFGSLLLVAGGWLLLRRHQPQFPTDRLPAGLGRLSPFSLALFGVGLFSLLGLPFTLGFAGHWQLLTAVGNLAQSGNLPWWLPAVALLGLGIGAAGTLRLLATLLAKPDEEHNQTIITDPLWLQIMVGLALAAVLWLALSSPNLFDLTLPG
ncbi:proton-conducting transporter membrane subunit [Candidatus Leptofilum sp.]|uniref:proton-conducting transporter transmembrane domain-containing protein n=1 Tax=Candidatus Leptofilum sp. TaxID=3241576 RepID=UPI003B5CA4AA